MSAAGEEPEEAAVEEIEAAGEPRQMSERTAKVILCVVAAGALWGVVAAAPWVAYVVVGILLDRGWLKGRDWIGHRRPADDEPDAERPVPISALDIIEALHEVAGPHVFLADLAAELDVPKEDARGLVENLGIRVRRAVRNGDDTGVGVHKDDLPPLPRLSSEAPETAVDQGQPTNQRGLTVEELGQGGALIRDPADTVRHHKITD